MSNATFNRENHLHVTVVGGPTALLEYGGLRIVVDPTFDPPGGEYRRSGIPLIKLRGPALPAEALGRLDLALVSHDQHDDNLDPAGRALLGSVGLTLTHPLGASRLGGRTLGLLPWTSVDVAAPDGGTVQVTAVPAQHGPDGTEHLTGPVTGHVLRAPGWPSVYVSGDNASLDVVRQIARRLGPVDVAVVFAGAARPRPEASGPATVTSAQAAEAAALLGARAVVPVHYDGWRHFTEGADELRAAFEAAGLSERLVLPPLGERVTVAV
jgi:L-ascorbate metabolism protein UlaG (beta-lactamase superfamily)